VDHDGSYTRDEVLSLGIEAICLGSDGVHFLYRGGRGLRVDPRNRTTTLITNPAKLPEGPWMATEPDEDPARRSSSPDDTRA